MIAWAAETLVASGLLMLVVLGLRIPVARAFGPHAAYGLWLLPALRLILPPLPEAVAPPALHLLPGPDEIELLLASAPESLAVPPAFDWALLAAALWGAGALAFLGWHLLSYRRFVDRALAGAVQLPRLDRDGVEVCASPAAPGPFAAGIFLKTIVLPEDYRRRYARDELRLAIEHEVQHHRRGDMSANLAALVVLALHWWNPIAYFAHRAFRADQELACDALVLARATPDERHAYGSALLKSACDRLPVAACALGAGDDLKRRLKMMKSYRPNPRARLGGVIASGLIGGGLLLTASGGIAAETGRKVEAQVRTALAPVAPSLAPAAPPPATAAPEAPAAPTTAEPEAVEIALLHPHPEPPAMPAAAVPPAPPVPPAPHVRVEVDGEAIGHEVREALEEAQRDLAEARREIDRSRREALREAAHDRREALREAAHARNVAVRACPGARHVSVSVDGDRQAVGCAGWSDAEQAGFRRTMIASLRNARESIAAMDRRHMPEHAREQALASIDRQIERLQGGR